MNTVTIYPEGETLSICFALGAGQARHQEHRLLSQDTRWRRQPSTVSKKRCRCMHTPALGFWEIPRKQQRYSSEFMYPTPFWPNFKTDPAVGCVFCVAF